MRTVTIQKVVRKFDELDDKLQALVLSNNSDINTDYEWWENLSDDAKNVGLTISAFNVDGHQADSINWDMSMDHNQSITKILADHGKKCPTHTLALEFQAKFEAMNDAAPLAVEMALPDVKDAYAQKLAGLYLDMLRREYEDRCDDEMIAETLKANDYEFDEKGNIWSKDDED
jgi:hypothetical protein